MRMRRSIEAACRAASATRRADPAVARGYRYGRDVGGPDPLGPPADVAAKMFTYSINPPEVDKLYTRLWTEVKTGR